MLYEAIRPSQIQDYIGQSGVMIIDLRKYEAYCSGHIPGAISIPYEELQNRLHELEPQYILIFYCERGSVSLMAIRDLRKYKFHMKSLHGGIRAYRGRLEKFH